MKLSIIIPAYNEEERIGQTLDHYLELFSFETEFLVVLNGCHDNTLQVVKERCKKYRYLRYIDIKEGIGKGGAIREGFKRVEGDFIGFVDADEATSAQEYKRLFQMIGESDGVIASRSLKGAKADRTFFRKIVSLGFFIIVKLLFHLPFRDTQCGAKIFKKKVIKKILPELKVNNMVFDVELLYLARKYNFTIKEIPTVWEEKDSSALLGSPLKLIKSSLKFFLTLIKLRLRIR